MRVRKSASRSPRYPVQRQFLAALGLGVLASSAVAEPPRLAGVPPPPPPKNTSTKPVEEPRLLGDIAVVPVHPVPTNVPLAGVIVPVSTNVCPPAGTNAVPPIKLPGEPPALPPSK